MTSNFIHDISRNNKSTQSLEWENCESVHEWTQTTRNCLCWDCLAHWDRAQLEPMHEMAKTSIWDIIAFQFSFELTKFIGGAHSECLQYDLIMSEHNTLR